VAVIALLAAALLLVVRPQLAARERQIETISQQQAAD
jgi:hypothetical protein